MEKTREFMKKKSSYVIILLFVIIALQTLFISSNTLGGNVLNYSLDTEQNKSTYIAWNMVSHVLKQKIPEQANIVYLFGPEWDNDQLATYTIQLDLLPRTLLKGYLEDYLDESQKNPFLTSRTDYLLTYGDDLTLFGQNTEKQITLFRVVDKTEKILEKVYEFDFSLYDLYQLYEANNETELFEQEVAKMRKQVIDYWDISAISLLHDLVLDASEDQNDEVMKEHAKFYLEHVDFISDDINMILGDYYFQLEEDDQAKFHYEVCTRNDGCDLSRVEKQLERIEMRTKGGKAL